MALVPWLASSTILFLKLLTITLITYDKLSVVTPCWFVVVLLLYGASFEKDGRGGVFSSFLGFPVGIFVSGGYNFNAELP